MNGCLAHLKLPSLSSKCKYSKSCPYYTPRPCDEDPKDYCGRYRTWENKKRNGMCKISSRITK